MKAIKRIIARVFVCMFAVTGGLNALALTPTEDSSTVVSQPVSEGISSETSSQTGSVQHLIRRQILCLAKDNAAVEPGKSRRIKISLSYQSYLSGAWQNSVLDNAVSGTVGQAKQIEGIKISFAGQGCFRLFCRFFYSVPHSSPDLRLAGLDPKWRDKRETRLWKTGGSGPN